MVTTFELCSGASTESGVPQLAIVKGSMYSKIAPSLSSRVPPTLADQFELERGEEAFRHALSQQFPLRLMSPRMPYCGGIC